MEARLRLDLSEGNIVHGLHVGVVIAEGLAKMVSAHTHNVKKVPLYGA